MIWDSIVPGVAQAWHGWTDRRLDSSGLLACVVETLDAKAPVLVELFSSEGCSSFPPADALLQAIDGLHSTGTIPGLFNEWAGPTMECPLASGDVLALYTDS